MRRAILSGFAVIALAFATLLISSVVTTGQRAAAQETRELVVGTKEAPPFAMKNEQGEWSGISIELWRKLADQLKLRYRFVETSSVTELLDGLQGGSFDAAVAAISVTPAREEQVDFTLPYFQTG